ncbi:ATP-binding cassette domain-containing protein [Acidobacteriota bacterium]
MSLLGMKDVCVGFGGPLLLDKVNVQIEHGERVTLLGRNGSGKTTLLRLMNGDIVPDAGNMSRKQGLTTALLTQEIPQQAAGVIYDIVTEGSGKCKQLLSRYHYVSGQLAEKGDKTQMAELDRLQQALDAAGGWEMHRRVENIISHMRLDPDVEFDTLSAGLKRRVLLARALVSEPDILLLDEPTNHMDIEIISMLKKLLTDYTGTFIMMTHDRVLVRKLARRILEIDRKRLSSWSCDYKTFLERKAALLESEQDQWTRFDKKLAKEETWIRQGIKARRTRNEGRVTKLMKMREVRRQRRAQISAVRLLTPEAKISGNLVIEAKGVSFSYDERPLIDNFTCTLMRGDRIGIIGPNGSGKTTLLRLLLSELTPQSGSVRHGTNLQIVYFDQLRAQLDEEKTVQQNVAAGNDLVSINGMQRHIVGYLQDFLFTPERARTQVKLISGGERNRLLLARLFTQPANLLIMDEPTNDLDIETLELLEELLLDFGGTLLLVSHDRVFLNNVVISNLVLEGEGVVSEYIGGYDDWLSQRQVSGPGRKDKGNHKEEKQRKQSARSRKLTFNEERELETLPQHIEALEKEQQQLFEAMADPDFFKQDGNTIVRVKDRLMVVEKELGAAYERWQILEEIKTAQAN